MNGAQSIPFHGIDCLCNACWGVVDTAGMVVEAFNQPNGEPRMNQIEALQHKLKATEANRQRKMQRWADARIKVEDAARLLRDYADGCTQEKDQAVLQEALGLLIEAFQIMPEELESLSFALSKRRYRERVEAAASKVLAGMYDTGSIDPVGLSIDVAQQLIAAVDEL
jgi:hypothetical protein